MRTGCGYDDILDGNTDNYVIFSHFIKLIQPYWTHNSYLEEQRGETLGYNVENMRTPLFLINKSVQFHPKKKVFWKPCSVHKYSPLLFGWFRNFPSLAIWSGHSKHSRAEEQPSCWLEVSRKGNPSIFSVGYCQLINREIGPSSSLNTLSTHSTHFLAAENTLFINHPFTILPIYGLIISILHTSDAYLVCCRRGCCCCCPAESPWLGPPWAGPQQWGRCWSWWSWWLLGASGLTCQHSYA